jgi:hypothetical protein
MIRLVNRRDGTLKAWKWMAEEEGEREREREREKGRERESLKWMRK